MDVSLHFFSVSARERDGEEGGNSPPLENLLREEEVEVEEV